MFWRLYSKGLMLLALWILIGCGGGGAAVEPTTQPTAQLAPTAAAPTAPVSTTAPPDSPTAEATAAPTEVSGRATLAPETTPATASEAAGCDYAYFPLRAGATWTYKTTGVGQATEYTQEIGQVSGEGAEMVMKVGDVTISNEIICTEEGIQMGRLPTISSEQAGGLNAQFEPVTAEGVYILAEDQLVPGAKWTAHYVLKGKADVAGQQIEMTNDMTLAFEVVGSESVTVPAGTFEALKVKQQITSKASMQGAPVAMPPLTFDQFVWFAEGVGMVKTSGSIGDIGEATTELQSYSIP